MTGDELRSRREALGLSQTRLAEILETNQSTVSKWESGRHDIPGHLRLALDRLADELH